MSNETKTFWHFKSFNLLTIRAMASEYVKFIRQSLRNGNIFLSNVRACQRVDWLLKEDTSNTFGSNRSWICKIPLKIGFRVNLSLSLPFEVGFYVKSNNCQGESNRRILEALEGQHPNCCCQSVGHGRESMNFGVIQTGVWNLAVLCIDLVSSGKLL